jgi:hypothetical protein
MRPSDTYFFPTSGAELAPQAKIPDQDEILHDAVARDAASFPEAFLVDDTRQVEVSLSADDRLRNELGGGIVYFDSKYNIGWINRADDQPTTVRHGLPYDCHEGDDGTYGVSTFALMNSTHGGYEPILVLLYTHRDRLDWSRLTEEEIRRSYPALIVRPSSNTLAVYQKSPDAAMTDEYGHQYWRSVNPDQTAALQTELARYWDTLRSRVIDTHDY